MVRRSDVNSRRPPGRLRAFVAAPRPSGEPAFGGRLAALLLATLLAPLLLAGCGGVVLGFADGGDPDLRLDGPVAVTVTASGQVVSGRVVNAGDLTADDVEATLTTYVLDASGRLAPWQTVLGVPVVDEVDGDRRLRPGDRGVFASPLLAASPPVEAVDVEIRARFHARGGLFFFFFAPGLVIIIA